MGSSTVIPLVFIVLILTCDTAVTEGLQFATNGQPSNVNVLEGETTQFHCLFTGFEPNTTHSYIVQWEIEYHNKTNDLLTDGVCTDEIKATYSISTSNTLDKSTLTIRNVSAAEQRSCRCHLSGGYVGLTSTWGYLSVLLKPEFRQMPSDKIIDAGQNVTLLCHVENADLSYFQVRWFRNSELVLRNYDTLNRESEVQGEITVRGNRDSGMFNLLIIDIKRNGTFYCDVYLTGQNRVVLKSSIARIAVRDSLVVLVTAISTISEETQTNKQLSANNNQLILSIAMVSVVVLIGASVVAYIGYKLTHRRSGGNEAVNSSGNNDESQRNRNTKSERGDVEELEEMQDTEVVQYEELKPVSSSSVVTKESVSNTYMYDVVARSKDGVITKEIYKQKLSAGTPSADYDRLTSSAIESFHEGNDVQEKKSRNADGCSSTDLELQQTDDPQWTSASVIYEELEDSNINKV